MIQTIYQILILIFLISCRSYSEKKKDYFNNRDSTISPKAENNKEVKDTLILREVFVDSTSVGKKGKNKLEARLFETTDSIYIRIEFYSRKKRQWKLKNHFEFEKDGISGIDAKLLDFNNDSFLDFHYKALTAARGANDVRRLFIYSVQGDSLILIKNSLDYPNIVYNKRLNCVDAWLIHGCSSQAFLKINQDSLIDFAWIQLSNGISVYEIDENRNEKIIMRDTSSKYECYTRFESYNPLIEYKNHPEE